VHSTAAYALSDGSQGSITHNLNELREASFMQHSVRF